MGLWMETRRPEQRGMWSTNGQPQSLFLILSKTKQEAACDFLDQSSITGEVGTPTHGCFKETIPGQL